MSDVFEMLNKQAKWQRQRVSIPWPEKVRMVERMRASLAGLSRAPQQPTTETAQRKNLDADLRG
jgi:hypothetical protein